MALETMVFDLADYLTDPAEIAGYLEAEFEDYDRQSMVVGLEAVIRARHGVDVVANETGVSTQRLLTLAVLDDAEIRATATQVMNGYRTRTGAPALVS